MGTPVYPNGFQPRYEQKGKPVYAPANGSDGLQVKYIPVGYADTHSKVVGYLLWVIGFTGAHRFYYGRPVTGTIWFFSFGLLGVGWILDAFLIPAFDDDADFRFQSGTTDYNIAWMLLVFAGLLGVHRMYQCKFLSGLLFLLTGGLFGIGWVYDLLTLNEQVSERNAVRNQRHPAMNSMGWA